MVAAEALLHAATEAEEQAATAHEPISVQSFKSMRKSRGAVPAVDPTSGYDIVQTMEKARIAKDKFLAAAQEDTKQCARTAKDKFLAVAREDTKESAKNKFLAKLAP